ncbi:MAG: ribbon-helix-helix domain-containing protein [Polyangiaceae bacterium]
MPGNPKDSEWYSTPRAARKRRGIELTLPPECIERLDRLAKAAGKSRSEVVEALIRSTKKR